jgi:hypothetical protein
MQKLPSNDFHRKKRGRFRQTRKIDPPYAKKILQLSHQPDFGARVNGQPPLGQDSDIDVRQSLSDQRLPGTDRSRDFQRSTSKDRQGIDAVPIA